MIKNPFATLQWGSIGYKTLKGEPLPFIGEEERDQQFEQRHQAYSNENHNEDVYITIAHEIPHEVYITAEL